MKVSINIKLTKNGESFSWSSALKFKTNLKPLSSGDSHFSSIEDAMLDGINTSLDAIKSPCKIDVFCNNLGSIDIINKILAKTIDIKSKHTKHTLKFYAS